MLNIIFLALVFVQLPDEPVVKQPGAKPEIKVQKTTPSDVNPSLMPLAQIKNKLDSLRIGQTAYIAPSYFKVDVKRQCWISPATLVGSKSNDRTVMLRRESNGFHASVDLDAIFETDDNIDQSWVLLVSITVGK